MTFGFLIRLKFSSFIRMKGGGESLDKLYDRCTSALQRIGDKHKGFCSSFSLIILVSTLKHIGSYLKVLFCGDDEGERVVVVTHGGVIRSLYERACPSARKVEKILNTSVNVFRLFDGDKWTIQVWGDVTHLDQTGFLQSGFGGDRTSG